jgi:hypothetical protein
LGASIPWFISARSDNHGNEPIGLEVLDVLRIFDAGNHVRRARPLLK